MSLVFAGICSHAPGITGRAQLADRDVADDFFRNYRSMGDELAAARPDVLVIVAAEHFANFFMNNMPAFAIGLAESYEGPIEDPQWLGIPRTVIPGNAPLVAAFDTRNDADGGSRLRRGMEIRSWRHGAVEFPDAPIRPPGDSAEHQLSGAAAGTAASRLDAGRGFAPRRGSRAGTHRPGRHRRHFALAGDPGFGEDQRRAGTGSFCGAGWPTTSKRSCPTATRRPTAMPAKEVSRSAPSSALPRPRRDGEA